MTRIRLPRADGTSHDYTLRGPGDFKVPAPGTRFNRVAYSAAHVVADPLSSADPWLQPAIDWDATLAYKQPRYDIRLNLFNLANKAYYDALIQSDGGRSGPMV